MSGLAIVTALEALADPAKAPEVARFYAGDDPDTVAMGVPIGRVFPVAKAHADLDLATIETLLDDRRYEVRMAAVAVMDFQARRKRADHAGLYDLYLRRHDRIDNWDLVDRAAPHVIGEWLVERDRSVLDRLAGSRRPAERRTALVATHAFIKRGDTADTFRIAARLVDDPDPYVQKAIGSWTREAGKRDPDALIALLNTYRSRLPRPTATAAAKLLPPDVRERLRQT